MPLNYVATRLKGLFIMRCPHKNDRKVETLGLGTKGQQGSIVIYLIRILDSHLRDLGLNPENGSICWPKNDNMVETLGSSTRGQQGSIVF